MAKAPSPPCPYCGRPLTIIEVHGHGQCAACGANIDPCCSGEQVGALVPEPPDEGASAPRTRTPPERTRRRPPTAPD
ncbi:MAG: hypothetical protein KDA22_13060 [Phycisphaerales bacterium]|nr:hypothetical protein [Phycisphaerales bacterium]